MAVNKDPFIRSRSKDGLPKVFRGLVRAGSTQAIKIGEICALNKTAGYFTPITVVNDFIYALAISREEQKSDDLERYIEFYALAPEDEFEFQIDAARALALGDTFLLTVSDSQKLTYSATGFPVARCVDDGHYPQKTDTTIRNRSYAVVSFNPACTYWGLVLLGSHWGVEKVVASSAALTLYGEMSGLLIKNTGAGGAIQHLLPASAPAGTRFRVYNTVAQAHGFSPNSADSIWAKGADNANNKDVSVDAISDALEVIADGLGEWLGIAHEQGNETASAAVTVEG